MTRTWCHYVKTNPIKDIFYNVLNKITF